MPDKDDINDLYLDGLDDDLAEFLNEADSGVPAAASEAPAEKPAPAAEPKKTAPEAAKSQPPPAGGTGEASAGGTQDWIENAQIDLPGQLALDIYETKEQLFVVCRVAGVEEENIDVSISADNILNIRGNLVPKIEESVDKHFIQECYWGEFSRSVSLPTDVKKENINAVLENGILKIIFVKIKQDAIKKIDVKTSTNK